MRDFFAGASHELKTPLMAITSYADGLSRGIVDESTACAVIDKECVRMNGLVADILAFSKLDGGMVRLQKLDTDVREILYDALQSIAAALRWSRSCLRRSRFAATRRCSTRSLAISSRTVCAMRAERSGSRQSGPTTRSA